jgi:transposase
MFTIIIERSAGPGLITSLIVSKTGDHLPIYRSEEILVRQGLHDQSPTLSTRKPPTPRYHSRGDSNGCIAA